MRAKDYKELGFLDKVENYDYVKNHHFADYKEDRINIPQVKNWGLGNAGKINAFDFILSNRFLAQ